MPWTQAQLAAIGARGSNLLVSAAAGSGKTAVLTERIVSLVREGVRVDALLVVTFTKAAAAEMRARILLALHDAADEGDRHLAEEAMRVERAHISTLHGFCGQVCRDHFQAAGVDPTFRILDGPESAVLRDQALSESLTDCFEREEPAFMAVAQVLTQEALAEAVLQLYRFLMARPDPWPWLDEVVAAHFATPDALECSGWMAAWMDRVHLDADVAVDAYARLEAFACAQDLFIAFTQQEAQQAIQLCQAARAGHSAVQYIPEPSFQRKPPRRKDMDAVAHDRYMELRKVAKSALQKAAQSAHGFSDLAQCAEDERAVGILLSGLSQAVRAFAQRYTALKEERNVFDFNDLEHCAYRALTNEKVSAAMRSQFQYVFVDEYQDSSLLQEAILNRVRAANNLFVVGDVKQSIYRFRLAEPALFLQKLNDYSAKAGTPDRKISLNANFRSQGGILAGINAVFERVFIGGTMELLYDADARLAVGVETTEIVPIELHLITSHPDAADDSDLDDDADDDRLPMDELAPAVKEAVKREADIIAERIHRLMRDPAHSYRWRDMAILMRTVRGKANQLVEALRDHGIAAVSDLGEDVLQRVEVQSMVSLLQIIDNMRQDVPLIATLRGPMLNLTDDLLAAIRVASPEGSFADAVIAYMQRDDALAHALRDFSGRVRAWALDAQVLPLDSLLRRIYDDSGLYAIAGARPDGDLRQTDLRMLAEYAGQYQRAQYGGLGGFLRYLERIQAHEGLAAQELGEQDDVVRVMSIHKSKGLQFPVVFLCGLGRKFSDLGSRNPLQMHSRLGIGMQFVDPVLRVRRETLSHGAIREKHRQEALAEEARILYVGMTRAQDRLILAGSYRGARMELWQEMEPENPTRAQSMLDWIVPVALHGDAWSVKCHSMAGTPMEADPSDGVRIVYEAVKGLPKPTGSTEVLQALNWETPSVDRQPIKQSVSAVVSAAFKQGEADEAPVTMQMLSMRPLFMEQRGLTAAERGDAVHIFLRAIPLQVQDVYVARDGMKATGLLSEEQAAALPMHKLSQLIQGSLWQRMRAANVLYREKPFNFRVDRDGKTTLLQGIIDCCFIEDAQWVLVDYKTDQVENLDEFLHHYRPQVNLYATALAAISGIPVRERILYAIQSVATYEVTD